jgi:hypothetical protein
MAAALYPAWADPARDTLSERWGGQFCRLCGLPVIRSDIAHPGALVHAGRDAVAVPHNVDDTDEQAARREQQLTEVSEAFADLRRLEDRAAAVRGLAGKQDG